MSREPRPGEESASESARVTGEARTRREAFNQRLEELSTKVDEWFDEVRSRQGALREIIDEARRQAEEFQFEGGDAVLPPTDVALETLAGFAGEVECSADQVNILKTLVTKASDLAPRVLLLVLKEGTLRGWAAAGLGAGFQPRSIVWPIGGDDVLSRACSSSSESRGDVESVPANRRFADMLGDLPPREMLASPMWVRDRVAAVLFADTGADDGEWYPEAIHVMVSMAALSLEALPARAKHPRPSRQERRPAAGPARERAEEAPRTKAPEPRLAAAVATQGSSAQGDIPEDEGDHEGHVEDARRFARLLVSEIVLYNHKEIEEGRLQKDLYQRLKEDIERSRAMYEDRVSKELPEALAYFREEIVDKLAGGDESAIDLPWG